MFAGLRRIAVQNQIAEERLEAIRIDGGDNLVAAPDAEFPEQFDTAHNSARSFSSRRSALVTH